MLVRPTQLNDDIKFYNILNLLIFWNKYSEYCYIKWVDVIFISQQRKLKGRLKLFYYMGYKTEIYATFYAILDAISILDRGFYLHVEQPKDTGRCYLVDSGHNFTHNIWPSLQNNVAGLELWKNLDSPARI